MSQSTRTVGTTLILACALAACKGNRAAAEAGQPELRAAAGITWTDFAAPGFAPGMKISVLHGDPGASGDYTLRLRFPDGYKIPPHWHPVGEHATMLSGTLMLGMGERFDSAGVKAYQVGDFAYLPAKTPHFGLAKGETIIQLHGVGPFQVVLVSPAK